MEINLTEFTGKSDSADATMPGNMFIEPRVPSDEGGNPLPP